MIRVYVDTAIASRFLHCVINRKSRKPKKLYKKLVEFYEKLQQDY
jgi:hypothetical protein